MSLLKKVKKAAARIVSSPIQIDFEKGEEQKCRMLYGQPVWSYLYRKVIKEGDGQ